MKLLSTAIRTALLALAITGANAVWAQGTTEQKPAMQGGMVGNMTMPEDAPVVPPVTGYAEGEQILFLHTEASDEEIARVLTEMMGSPVLVVPSLAQAPEAMLANVYVFANGVQPDEPRGPLEFQPDVFDSPPEQSGYSPLRKIVLVTWQDEPSARILKSAAEVQAAINAGEVTTEEPGVVVNMPLLTWPGGQR